MATSAKPMTDGQALDEIHGLMDGRVWDGAADLLEAIAEIIRSTRRRVRPPIARVVSLDRRWNDDDGPVPGGDHRCDVCGEIRECDEMASEERPMIRWICGPDSEQLDREGRARP